MINRQWDVEFGLLISIQDSRSTYLLPRVCWHGRSPFDPLPYGRGSDGHTESGSCADSRAIALSTDRARRIPSRGN
jgi:hypothetical protein